MRFALVNGQKTEPQPKLRGVCPSCQAETVARCGEMRVHHWSHKGVLSCDPWWEKETEWHRNWKSHFPVEWQEVGHIDEATGERHIADVKTDVGLVIEFQHSHLKPDERRVRERFYKNMVWVVDGARLVSDFPRLLRGRMEFRWLDPNLCLVGSYEKYLPKAWLNSSVPVVFDFRAVAVADEHETSHESLWCLLPSRTWRMAALLFINPPEFIKWSANGELVERCNQVMADIENIDIVEQALREERAHVEEKTRPSRRKKKSVNLRWLYSRSSSS